MNDDARSFSGESLPIDHADDDLGADDLQGTAPFVADVRVLGAVRVQELAVDCPVMRSTTLTTTAEAVVPADPRRSRVWIICAGSDFYLGNSRAAVDQGVAAILPANTGMWLKGRRALFAKTTSGTGTLSVIVESLG